MTVASSKRLMVVEDSEELNGLLKYLFESEGYSVVTAYNGLEALSLLSSDSPPPDLILLDLMMPVMDGIEFRLRQVQDKKFASIPVLVMSADGNLSAKETRMNATGYIKKPLDIDQLLEVVKRHCASEESPPLPF